MLFHSQLTELHRIFVELYPTIADVRRLISFSGVELQTLNFEGSVNNVWYALLLEVNAQEEMLALVSVVLLENPNCEKLKFYTAISHNQSTTDAGNTEPLTANPPLDSVECNEEDEEITYRMAEEVAHSTVGCLRRVCTNYALPNELPVYQLNSYGTNPRFIRIGRSSQRNTIVIVAKCISREHALIVQKNGKVYMRDNASTSGTYLNGRRLNCGEELAVQNGDLIGFGSIVYEYNCQQTRANVRTYTH